MSSNGEESKNKKRVEASCEIQNLRKLHEKDVVGVLKQLRAYHHKAQALNVEGLKLAQELIDISNRCRDDNDWGHGFLQLGETTKHVEGHREQYLKFFGDEIIGPLSIRITDETKNFIALEARINKSNKDFDQNIQKLAVIANNQRKKDPSVMLKSMEDLTKYVTETDNKREEMLEDLAYLEHERFFGWYTTWARLFKSELQFYENSAKSLHDLRPTWESLEAKVPVVPSPSTRSNEPTFPPPSQTEPPTSILEHQLHSKEDDEKKKKSKFGLFKTLKRDKDEKGKRLSVVSPTTASNSSSASHSQRTSQEYIKCRVLYDYQAQREDELSLKVGELVTIIKKHEDSWWVGTCNDRSGVFPSTYVELIKEAPTGATPTPPTYENNAPAQTGPRQALPANWEEAFTNDGQMFFFNTVTGESSWEFPVN